jgi:hypothetical protein
MKSEIELARARRGRTAELAEAGRDAHQRVALYRARPYGPKVSSPARVRMLDRDTEQAGLRLQLAQNSVIARTCRISVPAVVKGRRLIGISERQVERDTHGLEQ